MANRYWVGDSGFWSQTSHWSDSSGGAGGFSVPTSSDDVFFDVNSFTIGSQTVQINTNPSFCKSLDMTGSINDATLLSGGTNEMLEVYGNFIREGADGAMSISSSNGVITFMFVGTGETKIIDGQGDTVADDGIFNFNGLLSAPGLYDTFNLTSTLNTFGNGLYITGTFNTNNNNIFTGFVLTGNGAADTVIVNMGSGTWRIDPPSNLIWSSDGYVQINADTSIIQIFLGTSVADFSMGYGAGPYADIRVFNSIDIHGSGSVGGAISFTGKDLIFNGDFSASTNGSVSTVNFSPNTNVSVGGMLSLVGAVSEQLYLTVSAGNQMTLGSAAVNISYVTPAGIIADGAIPFFDFPGGIDGGNTIYGGANVNWRFGAPVFNSYLQNTQMVASDSLGTVQTINAGKSDDGTPIYYELQTQELEFGNRMHLKKIADKIVVFTQFGEDSQLQVRTDENDWTPVRMSLANRVNIGKDINTEGHYITFKWFGESSTTTPVFEGLYIEDITSLGMVYG